MKLKERKFTLKQDFYRKINKTKRLLKHLAKRKKDFYLGFVIWV